MSRVLLPLYLPTRDMGRRCVPPLMAFILFAVCAFLGLAAIWKCGNTAYALLHKEAHFSVMNMSWADMSPLMTIASVAYGVLIGIYFATGNGIVLRSRELCILVVLLAAGMAAPVCGMYLNYDEIIYGFAQENVAEKLFSGLTAPFKYAMAFVFVLDWIVPCLIVGAVGTRFLAGICLTRIPGLRAFDMTGVLVHTNFTPRVLLRLLLLYLTCIGLIFLALLWSVESRRTYAEKVRITFATGSPEDVVRFMDQYEPDMFTVYGPSSRYGYTGETPLHWAATNPNLATFVAVTERAPVTSEKAIAQYLSAFGDALENHDIPRLERIAQVYSQKTCEDPPQIVHGQLQRIAQSMAMAVQDWGMWLPPADLHTLLKACAAMEIFTPKLASTKWEANAVGVLTYLRAEGWISVETLDALLGRNVSFQCDRRLVEELLSLGANPRQRVPAFPAVPDKDICPLLAQSLLRCNDIRVSEQLFAAGADPEAACVDGRTTSALVDELLETTTWTLLSREEKVQRRALLDEFLEKARTRQ